MLIRFNVKNFLSFSAREDGKSEEFSMLAGKMRSKEAHILATDKIKLLKFSAIYGANAAGKSNLVKAMSFMQQAVVRRLSERFADKYCLHDSVLLPALNSVPHIPKNTLKPLFTILHYNL